MKGKLIAIEGSDGCGKHTQTEMLYQRLKNKYYAEKVSFPNYKSNSSALIKMYLIGEFGAKPNEVNPYAASMFYAVDRYASYVQEWKTTYENGGVIIADRYTTSNAIHQSVKLKSSEEKEAFLSWLYDLEFNKFQLPVPDLVIFLDVPPDYSYKLIVNRSNKLGQESKDIHEKDYDYLCQCHKNACTIAKKYDWEKISCVIDGQLKDKKEIHEEIYKIVKDFLA